MASPCASVSTKGRCHRAGRSTVRRRSHAAWPPLIAGASFGEIGEGAGDRWASYLRRTDGSPPIKIADDIATSLSPDGKWVLTIPRGGAPRMMLVPTGPGEPRTIRNDGIQEYRWAHFMPAGQGILFYGTDARRSLRTYVTGLAGGAPHPIAAAGIVCNVVSPDGLLAATNGTDRGILLVPTGGGGEPRPVPGTGPSDLPFGWSADQRYLLAYRRDEVPARAFRIEAATGKRELWKQWAPADRAGVLSIADPQVAAGGRWYAYTYERLLSDLYLVEGLE